MQPISRISDAIAADVRDIGCKILEKVNIAAGIFDSGCKRASDVFDVGCKFASGVFNIGSKYAADIKYTGCNCSRYQEYRMQLQPM